MARKKTRTASLKRRETETVKIDRDWSPRRNRDKTQKSVKEEDRMICR